MHVGASLVANQEAPKAVQPRECPFDDPSRDAEAAAMRRAAPGEDGDDALRAEPLPMALRIVAPIALQDIGPPLRPATSAPDLGQSADQRVELRNVIDVRRAHLGHEGDTAGINDDVVFRALLTAIGWVRSSFFPPRSARTDALSTTAQRRSSRPRRRSSASNTPCNRRQTPARCHRTKRRQQVLPDPQPISLGSICHGMPLRRTKKMPVNAARFEIGGRPIRPRRGLGSKGSIRAHKASSRSRLDLRMADRTKRPHPVQGLRHQTFETRS